MSDNFYKGLCLYLVIATISAVYVAGYGVYRNAKLNSEITRVEYERDAYAEYVSNLCYARKWNFNDIKDWVKVRAENFERSGK